MFYSSIQLIHNRIAFCMIFILYLLFYKYINCTFVLVMRKIGLILFTIFFLISSSGAAFNLHYCGGKLKSISLFQNEERGCCGSKKKSMGCCKTHSFVYKIKTNSNSNNPIKLLNVSFKIQNFIPIAFIVFESEPKAFTLLKYFDPPVLYDNPIYLKHRVFLI